MLGCNHGLLGVHEQQLAGRQAGVQGGLQLLPCFWCVLLKHLLLLPVWDRLLGEVWSTDHSGVIGLKSKAEGATEPLKVGGMVTGFSLGVPAGPSFGTKPQQHRRAAYVIPDPMCLTLLEMLSPSLPFRHPTGSQPSAVSCRRQPCLPTPLQPKCHLTWHTAPLHPATWRATAGSTPGPPRCPPTAATSPPRWHSRACRQPGRAATPSPPPPSDAGAGPGAPWARWLLVPWAQLTDCSPHAGDTWRFSSWLVSRKAFGIERAEDNIRNWEKCGVALLKTLCPSKGSWSLVPFSPGQTTHIYS